MGINCGKQSNLCPPITPTSFCVPGFVILTAIVMGRECRDPNSLSPTTVSELYNRIVSILQSTENVRNREEISAIINKLKTMAFQGIEEGRLVIQRYRLGAIHTIHQTSSRFVNENSKQQPSEPAFDGRRLKK